MNWECWLEESWFARLMWWMCDQQNRSIFRVYISTSYIIISTEVQSYVRKMRTGVRSTSIEFLAPTNQARKTTNVTSTIIDRVSYRQKRNIGGLACMAYDEHGDQGIRIFFQSPEPGCGLRFGETNTMLSIVLHQTEVRCQPWLVTIPRAIANSKASRQDSSYICN